mgnify:CR=1 FL=1
MDRIGISRQQQQTNTLRKTTTTKQKKRHKNPHGQKKPKQSIQPTQTRSTTTPQRIRGTRTASGDDSDQQGGRCWCLTRHNVLRRFHSLIRSFVCAPVLISLCLCIVSSHERICSTPSLVVVFFLFASSSKCMFDKRKRKTKRKTKEDEDEDEDVEETTTNLLASLTCEGR